MTNRWLLNPVLRNLLGLLALFTAHFVSDQYSFHQRTGLNKTSPYFFLILMYGWIIFHNRILFDHLYLKGRRPAYFFRTFLVMGICSFNMHVILKYFFDVSHTLPQIFSFWVYTLAGLGVYVMFRYLGPQQSPPDTVSPTGSEPSHFNCTADGVRQEIPLRDILYIESLENYVKIITPSKSFLPRLSLKEAEDRLPRPRFIRISRSCIVNSRHMEFIAPDTIRIRNQDLKIGKVYKRYVEEQITVLRQQTGS